MGIHSIQRPLSADCELVCILRHAVHLGGGGGGGGEGRRGTCMLQWWAGSLCKLFQSLSVTDPLLYCVGPVLQAQTPQERSLCSLFNGLHMYAALSCDFFVLDREWLRLVSGYCCAGRKWRRRKWKSWGYSKIRRYEGTY